MERKNEKCVIVLDGSLPSGVAANTAAILGISLGKALPEMVGADVCDQANQTHPGIVEVPVPVLRGDAELLKTLRARLYGAEFSDVTVVDFSDLAQECHTYEEYEERMKGAGQGELRYLGLALCGRKKQVNRLTGSLPLLR